MPEPTRRSKGSVELRSVTKRYGALAAVDDVSLEVAAGEFVALLGPSGCGKTTTLKMLAGFEQPDAGDVLISGESVAGVPPYRRDVNTVFQQYALFPHMSIIDNVAFGPRSRGVDRATARTQAEEVLEIVRLAEMAGRRPHQLSGGQQQRVALARALVNRPSALLLDEPLGALDLKLRQAMQLELKRIHREVGITFILVTHDQEEALTMSDRIVVMHKGRIEQIGTPQEIYNAPATPFVAGFIGSANLWAGRLHDAGAGSHVAQVQLANGAHVPARSTSLTAGASVTLMVRPEHMHLSSTAPTDATAHNTPVPGDADAPTGTGVLRARIREVAFQGPTVLCTLDAGSGIDIVAHVPAGEFSAAQQPGADVWVTWRADDTRVLAAGG